MITSNLIDIGNDVESGNMDDLLRKSAQYKDLVDLPPYTNITMLDLGNCSLSALPTTMHEVLINIKVLFLSNNNFIEMPPIISQFKNLDMVAFKGNKMASIHPDCFVPNTKLRWIILTNNCISELPDSIGNCAYLQKLMLSGNRLSSIPSTISKCTELELIRLACNQLVEPPLVVLQLPKLKWVALANNTFLSTISKQEIWNDDNSRWLHGLDITTGKVLGRGASGITRAIEIPTSIISDSKNHDVTSMTVAVKTYHSDITSDGTPEMERHIALFVSQIQQRQSTGTRTSSTSFSGTRMVHALPSSTGFIHVYGQCNTTGSLVMEYLHGYSAIADPPSFESCTRDVYYQTSMGKKWSPNDTVQFVNVLLYSLQLLHQHGVTHGDLYGHNVLASFNDKIDAIDTSSPSINIRLSDFGASFIYDKDEEYGKLLEAIEVRAFQVILQEVIMYYFDDTGIDQCSKRTLLLNLVKQCNVLSAFTDLYIYWQQQQLKALASAFDDTSK